MASDRQKVIKTAEKMVARGRLEAAISEYRKVLEEAPNDTSTLNRVGDLYARLNRVSKATDLFRRTAENFSRQGFFVKAIAIYKKIIRLDPTQIGAYDSLAELYHRQGLASDALAQYQVVADYYAKHGDQAAAIGVYRNMVSIDPENPSYRLRLATFHQNAGNAAEALAQYAAIAELMTRHGKLEEAAQVYLTGLEVDASDAEYVADAVVRLRRASHPSGAERILRVAMAKDEETATLARSLVRKREAEGEGEEEAARPEFEEMWPEADEDEAADVDIEAVEVEGTARTEEPADGEEGDEELLLDLDAAADLQEEVESAATGEESEHGDAELVLDLDDPSLSDAAVEFLPEVRSRAEDDAVDVAQSLESASDLEFELVIDEEDAEDAEDVEPAAEESALEAAEKDAAEVAEPKGGEVDAQSDTETADGAVEEAVVEASGDDGEREDSRPTEIAEEIAGLLQEAAVLEKYEMSELAVGCLERVLALDPDHVVSLGRLIALQLDIDRRDEALAHANRFAQLALAVGETEVWSGVVERMDDEGFGLENGRFVGSAPAVEEVEVEDTEEVAAAEEELAADEAVEKHAEESVSADAAEEAEAEADAIPVASAQESESPGPQLEEVAETEPEDRAAADEGTERLSASEIASAFESVGADGEPEDADVDAVLERMAPPTGELEREADAREEAPEAPEEELPAEAEEEPATEGGWVDLASLGTEAGGEVVAWPFEAAEEPSEAATEPVEGDAAAASSAPDADGPPTEEVSATEFFDLATELEAELFEDDGEDDLLPPVQEQTIEEIVEGFRKGMEQTLSPEDFDTHYNLGVAYQEMGLLDEAIGEFQLAAKDPRYLVECCSLLAGCFHQKGYPELAVHWYEKALESPRVDEEERLGLLYEVGNLEMEIGEVETARRRFLEIYGVSSGYRDVVAKLTELQRPPE